MGNCVFKAGFGGFKEEVIKVVTSNGGIMELYPPITAQSITNEFPGHALYSTPNQLFSVPLLNNQHLLPGVLYYLLPLSTTSNPTTTASSPAAIYRTSFDHNQRSGLLLKTPEVFPRYNSTGVWKVKLVISPEQLSEILSHECRTEALIESVRTVAKFGNGVSSCMSTSSAAYSDNYCSVSS